MINNNSYQAKQFNLSGLNCVSDKTLEMHFKLYEGYAKETNWRTEKDTLSATSGISCGF